MHSLWFLQRFLLYNFFDMSYKIITFIGPLNKRYRRFLHFYCYCEDTAKHVHDNMMYL